MSIKIRAKEKEKKKDRSLHRQTFPIFGVQTVALAA